MKRKILIITGTRAEYGYIRPIIRLIDNDSELDYELIVTNMHLLDNFGSSVSEIENDGFKISEMIHATLDGYTNKTMVKSLGIFMISLPEAIERLKPDIILISGDRGEQLIGAIVGASMNIPVAHIQAGDVSGNIDGITRHAMTKFSHIHLVANQDAYDRVKKMGEEEFRIYITGAPGLDELLEEKYTSKETLINKYQLVPSKRLILVVQHPITEEVEDSYNQMEETMKAIIKLNEQCIVIYPNSDAGNQEIKKSIINYVTDDVKIFKNIPREDYLGLMKMSSILVGNSSSGIIEAPFFALPTVNIGDRQIGRYQGNNVINVNHNCDAIYNAILKGMSLEFKKNLKYNSSPYGDGKSSRRIVDILKNIVIDNKLRNKRMTY